MTFTDWVDKTRRQFARESPKTAAVESFKGLYRGGIRRYREGRGTTIWERGDWDVLLVLDAARTDTYNHVSHEYGLPMADRVTSNATCSYDWIRRNFVEHPEELPRVAYVTGNPFASHDADHLQSNDLEDTLLGHFAPLYKTEWTEVVDGVETIPPEPLTNHAIDTWRRRDELGINRMVVHYMQPHQPYRSKPEWLDVGNNLKDLAVGAEREGVGAWDMVRRGEISAVELWEAYRDNMRWVLDDVTDRLLTNLDADHVVISADHGNALGEFGDWGHPAGALSPNVRNVPWVRVDATDEHTVTLDFNPENADSDVEDQLQALGYR